jgi:hypothetical protein
MHAQISEISPELARIVGSESVDFITKAKRRFPTRQGVGNLFFGAFWTLFTSIFVVALFTIVMGDAPSTIKINGEPTEVSRDNLMPLLIPFLVVGLFMIIGLGMISWSLYRIFSPGGYFISTPTHLIQHRNSETKLYNWTMFSGNMEINQKADYGHIQLTLKTGKDVKTKNSSYFQPDLVYLNGIDQVADVFDVVRRRILEKSGEASPEVVE